MTEGLSRKKEVQGGHRSSTTRIISQIYETTESKDEVEVIVTKLRQCKLALQEKLEIIKQLDDEILQLVDDEEVENEIEQADTFKERGQRAMIDSSRALKTREGMVTITPSTQGFFQPSYTNCSDHYKCQHLPNGLTQSLSDYSCE